MRPRIDKELTNPPLTPVYRCNASLALSPLDRHTSRINVIWTTRIPLLRWYYIGRGARKRRFGPTMGADDDSLTVQDVQ